MPLSNTLADALGPVEVTGIPDGSPSEPSSLADTGYQVLGKLGEGAMGSVSLARDPILRRTVALKSLLPQVARDGALIQRFVGEMQITAQLDHPHIVPVYGIDRSTSSMSYAMKLVQGKELEHLLQETAALADAGTSLDAEHSLRKRLEIFVKVCDAIAYAHSRGVIHRDLKPSNIMIGRFNEVYVMDWGIARQIGTAGSTQDRAAATVKEDAAAGETTRTRIGMTIGTPLYMSPEQAAAKNGELDGRSDQYALGLMLQEVVTLDVGMAGSTVAMVMVSAIQGARNPMTSDRVDVPRELKAIVDKACRPRPEDRYASVAELAADVRRYLNDEEVRALPDRLHQRWGRWISKHRTLAIGLLSGTFLLGVAAAGGLWAYNQVELAEKRNREVRLVEVQADSSTRAQQLDATLVGYQQSLQRLAGAAGIIVERGDVPSLELLTEERFKPGERALEGLVDSRFYGKPVSLDWMVAGRAEGSDSADVGAGFGALQTLGPALPRTMIEGMGEDAQRLSIEAQREALLSTGSPIKRIGFTLENGLAAYYPGMSGLSSTADGRRDPLYVRAKVEGGVVWGPPSPTGDQTLLMTCATTIQTRDGRPLGVVQFDIDVGRAVTTALVADTEQVETSLLVDRNGKVLAQNAKEGADKEPETLTNDDVRGAIARGESGYVATRRNGRDVLMTYHPLASMDWYLVTVADVAKLEEAGKSAGTQPGSVPAGKASARSAPRGPVPLASARPRVIATSPPTASGSATASASVTPSASAPRPFQPGARPQPPSKPAPNPFEPWPIYQPKNPK